MSLREMRSREVCELVLEEEKGLEFDAVEVSDLKTGEMSRLEGPVDLDRYGPFPMELTNPRTGLTMRAPGIRLWVSWEDGKVVEKPLNVVSKRLMGQLQGDLEAGLIFGLRYFITASAPAPKTTFQIRRAPRTLRGVL